MSATAARTRSPVRVVLRFIASVMIVSGLLLIADAGITLGWQEPVSAFFARQEQAQLKAELDHPPPRVFYKRPLPGDAIGEIDMPAIGKSAYLVEGTDSDDLRKGPGHYDDTPMPGDHGTVGIAGHRTTNGAPFRNIDKLKRRDRIILEMPYGRFVYRVEKTQIVEPTALWVTDRVGYDRLVLSACHPLYSAAQRLIVFARFVRRGNSTVERS
jgi:sortase A